jgi:hypothetical protein
MPLVTIHQHPENNKVCLKFVQNWLRKPLYGLCRSCRWYCKRQLSYLPLGPLLLRNFEKNSAKQSYLEILGLALEHAGARRRRRAVSTRVVPHRTRTSRQADAPRSVHCAMGSCVWRSWARWPVPHDVSSTAGRPHRLSPLARQSPHVAALPMHIVAPYGAPYRDSVALTPTKHSHHNTPGYKSHDVPSSREHPTPPCTIVAA